MNIAVITSGYLPVPSVKGGAVETIVNNLIKKNEEYNKAYFTIFSIYDKKACEESKKLKNTEVVFIKKSKIVNCFDKMIFLIAKYILKKEKVMSYRYILQRLYFLRKVSSFLKKNDYDKVLLENHATLFLALKFRKNYKKYDGKYYYHLHNEVTAMYGCKKIMEKTKKILCVSNYIKENIIKKLNIDSNKVIKLENCIDTSKFCKTMTTEEKKYLKMKYSIKEEDQILLFTGRFTKEKGIRELLEAISTINRNNIKLLVVGSFFFDTDIKSNFEMKIKSYVENMKNQVIFTGYIPYEEINKIYEIADIAVIPSMWEDPAPLTIIEAMSSGLPIITTNSGGIPEYAKNGCAIILERNENIVHNLKKSIKDLLDNSAKRKNMAQISKKNSEMLNLDNFYFNFIKMLE